MLKIMFFILVFTFSPRTINYNVCDLSPGLSQGGPPLAAPAPGPLYFWKIRKMVPLVVPTPGPPLTELTDLAVWVWNGGGFVGPTLPGPLTLLSKNLLVIELSLLSDCSRRGHFWDASHQLVLSGTGAADDTIRSGQPASARSLASLRGLASGCVFW